MTAFQWIWTIWVGLGCAYGLVVVAITWRAHRAILRLAEESPPDPKEWPQLSVVIPACNEASTLEAAMSTKLVQNYPNVEFIVVDDRSTDDTGTIVDRIATRDDRVKPVHVTELPEGWIGKVHALHSGTKEAHGEWLLFTDADVHFEHGSLRHAVAYCEAQGLDHLTLLPAISSAGLLVDAAVAMFLRFVYVLGRPWLVQNDDPNTGVGIGAFNLVRRSALEKTGGFEELKLEVADDLSLGRMLKASGARPAIGRGRGLISVQIYSSLGELAAATERVAIVMDFSLWRPIVTFLGWLLLELAPYAGLIPVASTPLVIVSALTVAVVLGSSVVSGRAFDGTFAACLLAPFGVVLLAFMGLRGGIVGWKRGGLQWRGTHYDAATLLEGRKWGKI